MCLEHLTNLYVTPTPKSLAVSECLWCFNPANPCLYTLHDTRHHILSNQEFSWTVYHHRHNVKSSYSNPGLNDRCEIFMSEDMNWYTCLCLWPFIIIIGRIWECSNTTSLFFEYIVWIFVILPRNFSFRNRGILDNVQMLLMGHFPLYMQQVHYCAQATSNSWFS